VVIGGLITASRRYVAKNGRPMAFLTLEDRTGTAEVTVFPDVFERDGSALQPDAVVLVRGKAESTIRAEEGRGGPNRAKVLASALASLDDPQRVRQRITRPQNGNSRAQPRAQSPPGARRPAAPAAVSLHIRVLESLADRGTLSRLRRALGEHPGELPVLLHLKGAAGETTLSLSGEFKVSGTPELNQALEALVGEGAVWIEQKQEE
jgi:DNA polymerase-3 subunit alpha